MSTRLLSRNIFLDVVYICSHAAARNMQSRLPHPAAETRDSPEGPRDDLRPDISRRYTRVADTPREKCTTGKYVLSGIIPIRNYTENIARRD